MPFDRQTGRLAKNSHSTSISFIKGNIYTQENKNLDLLDTIDINVFDKD